MRMEDAPFLAGFVSMVEHATALGWHERNGGNLSYRLAQHEAADALGELPCGAWDPIGTAVPGIAGQAFLITAAGSYFGNVAADPAASAGIIEVDEAGTRYRKRWGFAGGARPTSEMLMHLLAHEVKALADEGEDRVVYHAHPVSINALTFVLPLTGTAFTHELWTTISECAMVFPRGIGVIEWMVPGSRELALASAEALAVHDAVIWPHHGAFCAGESFDAALGLLHTIEKAAEIAVKVRSMTAQPRNRITEEQVRAMDEAYSLGIDPDYLASVFQ